MKLSTLQKKSIFAVFAFIIGGRAVSYTYSKHMTLIWANGNFFDLFSLLNEVIFVFGILFFTASAFGFMSVIREIWVDNKEFIVRERFIKLLISTIWTFVVSIILALIVKILIWP